MAPITRELIRKKSEHNERIMDELEEISLHQLEIERIEVIGTLCRRLKILYLQNNIISKIENLNHLKELTYLNLALNNIQAIEGLESCEFLEKLDLTVNFIDLDRLEDGIQSLGANRHLRELYMVGNPAADWEGFKDYVIAELPTLTKLDGSLITKSMRIRAAQRLPKLHVELRELARCRAAEKQVKSKAQQQLDPNGPETSKEDEEAAPYTPELRTEMYREMAEEKAEKDAREKERMPKERNFEREHEEAVKTARSKTHFADGRVRQCNEGKLKFSIQEDTKSLYLLVPLPRFMDTSLVECDVHPTYVTVIAKNKTLRLALPATVQADKSFCQRSSTTGELKVTMPKIEPSAVLSQSNSQSASKQSTKPKGKHTTKATRQQQILAAVDIKTIYNGEDNPNLQTDKSTITPSHSRQEDQLRKTERIAGVPPLE